MDNQRIWSGEYSCYVSHTFLPEKERLLISNVVKINLADCDIHVSIFGYYSLWIKAKKLKEITFNEYLKYREYVQNIIRGDSYA